jgi:hypothetical protein
VDLSTTKGTAEAAHPVMSDWPDEQTDDPLYADDRNFYKVEAWSRDGNRIDALLYAGNNLRKAQVIFVTTVPSRCGPTARTKRPREGQRTFYQRPATFSECPQAERGSSY